MTTNLTKTREDDVMYDKFQMLYCDQAWCRVNTFERGDGTDSVRGIDGPCPGCIRPGIPIEGSR